MTFKEKLANNTKEALALKREFNEADEPERGYLAEEEMRKVICDYIYPILELMNKTYPWVTTLSIRVDVSDDILAFIPLLELNSSKYISFYSSPIPTKYLILAAFCVCDEYDLIVRSVLNQKNRYCFRMNLAD